MKKQVLVVHGGNAFEKQEEYLAYLQNKPVSLEKLQFKDWKRNLADSLGSDYEVFAPTMPNGQNARYAEWKIWFDKILPLMNYGVILVGHSLGAIFLVKYLSESGVDKRIAATFLVAAPYNTENQHPLVDFVINQDFLLFMRQAGAVYFYQSRDDKVVPFDNMTSYQVSLPQATFRVFDDRGHFNQVEFPELVADIRAIK